VPGVKAAAIQQGGLLPPTPLQPPWALGRDETRKWKGSCNKNNDDNDDDNMMTMIKIKMATTTITMTTMMTDDNTNNEDNDDDYFRSVAVLAAAAAAAAVLGIKQVDCHVLPNPHSFFPSSLSVSALCLLLLATAIIAILPIPLISSLPSLLLPPPSLVAVPVPVLLQLPPSTLSFLLVFLSFLSLLLSLLSLLLSNDNDHILPAWCWCPQKVSISMCFSSTNNTSTSLLHH
jgi:hypothetical protein